MVKISEELFVSTIKAIKDGLTKRDEFDSMMSKFSESYFISNIGEVWLEAAIKLLEDVVGDEANSKYGSTISWWLFEDVVDKVVYLQPEHPKNNTNEKLAIRLDTPEQLYSYFKNYN
jgi:hypothetical protein